MPDTDFYPGKYELTPQTVVMLRVLDTSRKTWNWLEARERADEMLTALSDAGYDVVKRRIGPDVTP